MIIDYFRGIFLGFTQLLLKTEPEASSLIITLLSVLLCALLRTVVIILDFILSCIVFLLQLGAILSIDYSNRICVCLSVLLCVPKDLANH